MSTDQIESIEHNIRQAKELVEFSNALDRLSSNRDFKTVIQEGYFQKEAIRLVHLKSDPSFQTPERQKSILMQIDSIGALSDYFRTVAFQANQAIKAIAANEETIDEIRAEELNNG